MKKYKDVLIEAVLSGDGVADRRGDFTAEEIVKIINNYLDTFGSLDYVALVFNYPHGRTHKFTDRVDVDGVNSL